MPMTQQQEQMLTELHSAVVGNEKMGQPGLVKRVHSLERWREGMMLKVATVTGAGIVVGLFLKYVLKG